MEGVHDDSPPRETTMQCPHCRTDLETRSINDIEIDECPSCQGIWFDADELRRVKDEKDKDLNWMDFEFWEHADRFRVRTKPVACPSCSTELVTIDYHETGVEIDHCTHCRGVWLDAGKLEKILESLSRELVSKDVQGYLKASLEEAKKLFTGSEGFLSEWRDLSTVLRMLQYRLLSNNPKLGSALAEIQSKSQF